jgi:AcrR family transcriptional regulator
MTAMPNGLTPSAAPLPKDIAALAPTPARRQSRPPRPVAHLSRVQILDATLQCLLDAGYDGTTIRQIARRLDCAVGSIYRYFKDKRDLLGTVTQRQFEPIMRQIEAGETLERTFEHYVRVACREPELYRLMFWVNSVGQTQHGASPPPVIAQLIDSWAAQMDDRDQAQQCWAQLHGYMMLGQSIEQIMDQMQIPTAKESYAPTESGQTVASLHKRDIACTPSPPPASLALAAAPLTEAVAEEQSIRTREDVTLL